MSYQPIENYGIIGNMRTVALVGMNGSIDWYCYPQFDSSSIFRAILDDKKGGCYALSTDQRRIQSGPNVGQPGLKNARNFVSVTTPG
jgi:GH15 family glucan-1,4-alpha-glucosidase